MDFFKNWMFITQSTKLKIVEETSLSSNVLEEGDIERKESEEVVEELKISVKEKLITFFLYLLMAAFAVSLISFLVMSFLAHPNAERVGEYLKYFSATLVGYFLGTNKERG